MQLVIGIDIGKRRHHATALTPEGKVGFTLGFSADAAGFARFLARLGQCTDPSATVMVGMEATGHYYENLFAFLLARCDPARTSLVLLNPLATSAYARSELLVAKTDAVDSALIARYLLRHQPAASPPTEAQRIELRRLTRSRHALVTNRTALVNALHAALDLAFPELPSLFRSLASQSALRLLAKYPTAEQVRASTVTRLAACLRGRHGRATADRVHHAAQQSVGVAHASSATALVIRQLVARLTLLNAHLAALDTLIARQVAQFPTQHLETIPGVGPGTLAVVLAEAGDSLATRFRHPDALVSFAGIAPRVRQSGRRAPHSAPMSKRGSVRLRRALVLSALAAIRCNPILRQYYERQLAAGKKKMVAVGAVARKLVHLMWGVARGNVPFDPHYERVVPATP